MDRKTKLLFLILVLVQGLHSIEEYVGKLWESFPPARALCSLVSDDHVSGFLVINISLFVVGMLCWAIPVRREYRSANSFVWLWTVLELINGIGHPIWTFMQGVYTPGIITAPILLLLAINLLVKQLNLKT